jgi:Tol biopolymer transport system component
MGLAVGTTVGPYEILAPLGAGGMGEVYRATDTRLGRDVALKVLPERVAESPELRERFEREARAVASLSHPGILAIHDFGTDGGRTFAAMELLEGETLRERLATGPISPRRATEYALQLAQALAAAHDRGVVHRDVKPENVFLTREGRVKVLDFGLARQASSLLTGSGDDSVSPTLAPGTEPGTVLGTVGYMSPEQVKGQEADARSDIFSFGTVLYEMLTGKRAFRGETAAETMTAILRADPAEPASVHDGIPLALERIVDHCLEKSPDRRFRTAHDLAFALETASGASSRSAAAVAAAGERPRWRKLAWGAAALLGLAVAVQAGRILERRAPAAPGGAAAPGSVLRLTNQPGPERWPQLSPDGKTLAFVAAAASSDEGDLHPARGRGKRDQPHARLPGRRHPPGLLAGRRPDRVPLGACRGGPLRHGLDRRVREAARRSRLQPELVAGRTGDRVSTVSWGDVASRSGWGELLGDRRLLRGPTPDRDAGRRRRTRWSPRVTASRTGACRTRASGTSSPVAAAGGSAVAVTTDAAIAWDPVWWPDGRHLYFTSDRGGTMNLWRVAIDEASGRVLGPPEPLTVPSAWAGHGSLSGDGRTLVYADRDVRTTLMRTALDAVRGRASGSAAVVLRGSLELRDQALSPDGEWIAFTTAGREDVFVIRADGTGFRQLTDDAFRDRGVAWSPDGQRLAFYSNREGDYQAFTARPDGSELKQVSAVPGGLWYVAWSPDGSELATCGEKGAWRIDLRQPVGEAAARRLPPIDETHEFCPRSWSPDGQALAGIAIGPGAVWRGLHTLSLASGAYRRLGDQDELVAWLDTGRLVVGTTRGEIQVVDARSGEVRELARGLGLSVSADGRWLTYAELSEEADVWMATLP